MIFFWVLLLSAAAGGLCVEGIGMNWGTIATHKLPPETVVQMLKDNGIGKVKLFNADHKLLGSLAGSGIEVMVGIANDQLVVLSDYGKAKDWVRQNITRFNPKSPTGVNITCVAVGNEPFLKDYNNSLVNVTFPALQNVQNALNEAGFGDNIKATVPLNADVYFSPDSNPVPSAGRFRPDIIVEVTKIVKLLNKNKSPFVVNIYPFLSLYYGDGQFPFDFAFFDGAARPLVDSNGAVYTNVFDANFDTLVSALRAEGFENITIVVGEIGWPTDGGAYANLTLASKFYGGLIPKLNSGKGTPMHPGKIEVYLFGLLDEDAKSILPGNFERHWGIFKYDGQPKFNVSFSSKNAAVPAHNVTYLPRIWCVLKSDAKNTTKIEANVNYACNYADCTQLSNGSSCGNLDYNSNVSYAFNAYFQAQNQVDGSCGFDGLAMVTAKNLSEGTCNFTIQIAPPPRPSPPPHSAPSPAPVSDSSTPVNGPSQQRASSGLSAAAPMELHLAFALLSALGSQLFFLH